MAEAVLAIGKDASDEQLVRAVQVLGAVDGAVMFSGCVALRRTRTHLLCEVLDPTPSAHRCARELDVLLENAQRMLAAARLAPLLPDLPRRWRVVEAPGAAPARGTP